MNPLVFLVALLIVPSVLTADRRYKHRKPVEAAPVTEGSLVEDKWQADFAKRASFVLQVLEVFEKKLEWFRKTDKIELNKESITKGVKQGLQSVLEAKDKLDFNMDLTILRESLQLDDHSPLERREKTLNFLCAKWAARGLITAKYKWMTGWDYDGTMRNMQWCYPAIKKRDDSADSNNGEEMVAETIKWAPLPEFVRSQPSQQAPPQQVASQPETETQASSPKDLKFSSDLFNELMGNLGSPIEAKGFSYDVPVIAPLQIPENYWS